MQSARFERAGFIVGTQAAMPNKRSVLLVSGQQMLETTLEAALLVVQIVCEFAGWKQLAAGLCALGDSTGGRYQTRPKSRANSWVYGIQVPSRP